MVKIFHYTSFETLLYILKNKTLRFTSLAKVDDLIEAHTKDYGFLAEYCYVSCWTRLEEESIPQWNMYSKDMTGVRIGLEFESSDDLFELVEYSFDNGTELISSSLRPNEMTTMGSSPPYKPKFIEIIYTDNEDYLIPQVYSLFKQDEENYQENINLKDIGLFKPTVWDFQKEVRFSVFLTPWTQQEHLEILEHHDMQRHLRLMSRMRDEHPNLDFIDIKLSDEIVSRMSIVTGPKCSDAQKEILQLILDKYAPDITFTDSRLKIQ